jgi:hypothetical protein
MDFLMNDASLCLPFFARLSLPDTLEEAELNVVLKGKDPGAKLPRTDQVFLNFLSAAQAGMFAGERIPPDQSHLQIVSRQYEGAGISYHCKAYGVDVGAFRILLNALAESCRRFEPLVEVSLTGISPSGNDTVLKALLGRPFPGRVRNVPFELKLREFFFENREPLIRMAFQRNLSDEEFDQIKPMMAAWDNILMLGGYLEPATRDAGFFPEPGELFLAEPTILEHLIYGFEGPEETFNAVINMAFKLHFSICPLVSLEIE